MFSPVPVSPDAFKACVAEVRALVDDPTVGLYERMVRPLTDEERDRF